MSGRPAAWLRLALGALLLFLAAWIVVPPPTYATLILAVGAPEVAAWLILGGGAVTLLAVRAGRSRMRSITVLAAVTAVALASVPFVRFAATARRFDAAMRAALGRDYLAGVAATTREGMRRHPLDPFELFTGLRGEPSRVVRGVRFAVNDGASLAMDIYRPAPRGNYPAVVQIYGGAWQRGAPADNPAFASYLAAHGYVVFAIDYRHAPRWHWPAQLADVRAALRWIAEHGKEYDADTSRLAVVGRSSGAQLAMVAAYAPGGPPVRAVVDYYGPVNLVEGYRHPPRPDPLDVRRIEEAFLGGTPDEAIERYRDASPITYAVRPLPPTLLVYAARDQVVEARFGAMLYERLRATGTTSVLLEIPWAEHGFDVVTGGPSAQLALYYTERFLAWAMSDGRDASQRSVGHVAAFLPVAGLPDLQEPGSVGAETQALGFGLETPWRLIQRLVCQIECAEVHGHDAPGTDVQAEAQCLFGGRMHEAHHRGGEIRTDGDGGEIDRTQPLADCGEFRRVAGVACVVETPCGPADHPAGP